MLSRPTPDEIVEITRAVVGEALLGAYLYGSATLGGLHRHSDVDVLGVLSRPSSEAERSHLVQRLLKVSGARAGQGPSRPVELTLVVRSDVRPWRYPRRIEFQYGEWLRDEYLAGLVPAAVDSPDLTTLLAMVLQSGRPLLGPPAAELLDPVPVADLRRAIIDSLPELLADLETDRNVVLTLARMWLTLETTKFAPKDVAADWALRRLPVELRAPLVHARDVYLGQAADRAIDVPAVRAFAAYAVREIESAYAAGAMAR